MGSEFIDRAKLEALAEERYPMHLPYNRKFEKDAQDRVTFMAGVDAALALLGAETTEEWGVQDDRKIPVRVRSLSRAQAIRHGDEEIVSRRVLYAPWLPSEGGES